MLVQTFNTGQITPGNPTHTQFVVDQFDTQGGALILTEVSFSISLHSWGGYYEVENITEPSTQVSGTITQGIGGWVTGALVPGGMNTTLFAGTDKAYVLPVFGNTDRVDGPTHENRNQTGPNMGYASESNFGLYEGTETYTIDFYSTQGSTHTADGAVRGAFESANSQGFLTVTYTFIPEPSTVAALLLGGACILGIRRLRRLA